VEEARLMRYVVRRARLQPGLQAFVIGDRRSRLRRNPTAVLRALKRETEAREILVRLAQPRAVLAGVGAQRPLFVLAHAAYVQFQRLPRAQAVANLIGKHARVAGDAKRILRDEAGGLMVAVPVALVPLASRDHDARTVHANDA